MRRLTFFALASLVPIIASPAEAATNAAPLRHISFSYSITATTTLEQQGSGLSDSGGIANGSAIQRSTARMNSKGTIDADILAATSDGGLVVRTSETGDNRQSNAEIAIKSDGTILTTATTKLTNEQRYLLSLLGRQIMPFSDVTVGQTWKIEEETAKGASDVTNFRITGVDGTLVHLAVQRVIDNRNANGYQLTLTGTVDYDYKRLVPTAGSLQTYQQIQGVGGLQTSQGLMTFSLAQDSFAKAG